MDEALALAISVLIICFGGWVFIVGLSSNPAFWGIAAMFPIVTGLSSAFGPK
jgi:hypothetical protein